MGKEAVDAHGEASTKSGTAADQLWWVVELCQRYGGCFELVPIQVFQPVWWRSTGLSCHEALSFSHGCRGHRLSYPMQHVSMRTAQYPCWIQEQAAW
eukprot:s1553_g17.t1